MSRRAGTLNALATTLRQLPLFPLSRRQSEDEARLYFQRALRAASEERYDVASVFCGKALETDSGHLPARLLLAQIYDRVFRDFDAAVAAYRKVITLAGYDAGNPSCAAAQEALDALISKLGVSGRR